MRILRYTGLDTSVLTEQYSRTVAAIARGDFRAAQVKSWQGAMGSTGPSSTTPIDSSSRC
jgi:hypothetical protein